MGDRSRSTPPAALPARSLGLARILLRPPPPWSLGLHCTPSAPLGPSCPLGGLWPPAPCLAQKESLGVLTEDGEPVRVQSWGRAAALCGSRRSSISGSCLPRQRDDALRLAVAVFQLLPLAVTSANSFCSRSILPGLWQH